MPGTLSTGPLCLEPEVVEKLVEGLMGGASTASAPAGRWRSHRSMSELDLRVSRRWVSELDLRVSRRWVSELDLRVSRRWVSGFLTDLGQVSGFLPDLGQVSGFLTDLGQVGNSQEPLAFPVTTIDSNGAAARAIPDSSPVIAALLEIALGRRTIGMIGTVMPRGAADAMAAEGVEGAADVTGEGAAPLRPAVPDFEGPFSGTSVGT
ncbi:MAG: hypothetical protein KDA24_26195 [Deltaproteobacteria bacterium]|nr:hypothetical protein [Deltaproteobacteria bacterium]